MSFLAKLTPSERKVIFLSALGGALEFYDFIIYIFFANTLSELFFPQKNQLNSLIQVFAVFLIGYLARPIGGILFGHFGDTYGRKKTFIVTLLFMALPTFLVGFLPGRAQIGGTATLLLVILRLIQGLSVGGEIPGAVTFAAEHVNAAHRGLTCAIIFFGINMGVVLGSLVSSLLINLLSPAQLLAWGWRIPFILGGILGIVSFNLRRQMAETPVFISFQKKLQRLKLPLKVVLHHHFPRVLYGMIVAGFGAIIITQLFVYMPIYLKNQLHYVKPVVGIFNTLNLLLYSFIFLIFGALSDRYGRRIFLLIGSFLLTIFGYGFFYLLAKGTIPYLIFGLLAISIASAFFAGVYPSLLVELFPTPVRYTGVAISYNLGFGIFGGAAPLISTYLIKVTGSSTAPAFYLIGFGFITFLSLLLLQKKPGSHEVWLVNS